MDIYSIHRMSKSYIAENRNAIEYKEIYALKNIDFTIKNKESVCIMGGSGSGKTTLLKMLGGMMMPSEGRICYKGLNLYQYSSQELEEYRRTQVGFVFQDYKLLDNLRVEDNIMLPLMINHQEINTSLKRVREMSEILEIEDKLSCYPYELSGGQQQRVAICRALMNNPQVILADEPTGNLDKASSKVVLELLLSIKEKFDKTLIMVTHSEAVGEYCDRTIEIQQGEIIVNK